MLCASKTASEISLFKCVSFGIGSFLLFMPFILVANMSLSFARCCLVPINVKGALLSS